MCSDAVIRVESGSLLIRAQFRQSGRPSPIAPSIFVPVNSSPLSTDNVRSLPRLSATSPCSSPFLADGALASVCNETHSLLNNLFRDLGNKTCAPQTGSHSPLIHKSHPPPPYLNAPGGWQVTSKWEGDWKGDWDWQPMLSPRRREKGTGGESFAAGSSLCPGKEEEQNHCGSQHAERQKIDSGQDLVNVG